jgi:ATP-dependent helicase/nuclease subunit A
VLLKKEEKHEQAEEIRLFYVAVTRARDHLILPLPDGEFKTGFMGLLTPSDLPEVVEHRIPAGEETRLPSSASLQLSLFEAPAVPAPRPGILTPEAFEENEEGREVREIRDAFQERRRSLIGSLPLAPRFITPSSLAVRAAPPGGEPGAHPEKEFAEVARAFAAGRVVHQVLQRVDAEGRPGRAWLERLMSLEPCLTPEDRSDVERWIRNALSHPLWKRAHASRHLVREAPFLARTSPDVYVDGIVDLAFIEDEAWIVVDWKTGRIGPEGVEPWVQQYRGQALAYVLGVEASSPLPVREVALVFLDGGQTVSFPVTDEVRREAGGVVGV